MFNERRRDLRILGLKNFIQKYNPIAYDRFAKIVEEDRDKFNTFILELHNDLNANDIYKDEVFEFLNAYLRDEGYLIHAGSVN